MNKISKSIAVSIATVAVATASASAALMLPTQNCSYSFTKNLKMGSKSSEVMNLQKVLNMFPQTRVAESGPGSEGMETMKFGPATRAAVVKFQNIHRDDILTPAGLSRGSGSVYGLTRAVLNQICTGNVINPNPNPNPNPTPGPVTNGPVSVMLAPVQPMGVLIAGQTGATLASFNFSGNGTVTQVKLMRAGASANEVLPNVYLYDGATRLTDASSVSNNGSIVFTAPSGLFTVNGSRTITVKADLQTYTQNPQISGQSVAVALVGYTTMGNNMSTVSLVGNSQNITSVNLAGFTLNSQTVNANPSLSAPQINYPVWSTSANVTQRAVNLKAVTFKRVGSALDNALVNVTLYVDGSSVGSAMPDANARYTFTPAKMLNTGTHTIELRADVVGGATRNFYFIIENIADISAEDSSFPGANVTVANYALYKQGGTMTISSVGLSSVTVSSDPSFQATNVVTGASNQTIAKYTLTAYGEDTKVQYLTVTATSSGISNVGVYVNGAQVGSNYSFASSTNTLGGVTTNQYSLGSNFIALAGQSNSIEIRADLTSSTGVNATGAVSAYISALQVYGNSSQNTYSPTFTPTVKTLTIGGGSPTLGKTVGAVSASMSANSNNVKIGSFSVQGGSVEGINVKTINLYLTASSSMSLNNVTSLTLKDEGGNALGTPQGIAATAQVYTVNFPVAIGQTKRFDVFANIGSAVNGNSVLASTSIVYTGMTSNQTGSVGATGDVITVATVLVGNPTVSNKVAPKYVLGGASQDVMTLNVTSQNGASTINDLTFTISGSATPGVQSLTVNGNTASVIGSTAVFTGVNIPVMAGNSGTNMTVKVNYTPAYVSNGTGVVTGSTNSVALTAFKYTDAAGNVTSSTTLPTTTGNTMTLVASLATVNTANVVGFNSTNVGVGTTNNVKLGSVTVTADAKGDIVVGTLAYSAAGPGTVTVTNVKVSGSAALDKAGVAPTIATTTAAFAAGYRITAGTTVTFDIYGTVVNNGTTSGNTSVTLGTASFFLWSDDAGSAGTSLNGTLLSNNYNN